MKISGEQLNRLGSSGTWIWWWRRTDIRHKVSVAWENRKKCSGGVCDRKGCVKLMKYMHNTVVLDIDMYGNNKIPIKETGIDTYIIITNS